ncbi:hypothetical protein MMC19_005934 [Ptychographa xylographoides]|nr:hypothetical protein [Ptychographa xylographoides]
MATSPFAVSTSKPGHGTVHLDLLPPATPTFSTLTYAYPLKLLPSTPHILTSQGPTEPTGPDEASESIKAAPTRPASVPLLFLLSYGGGLLPPDSLTLAITLASLTRLTITTQGSTKIFPSPTSPIPLTATQTIHVSLAPNSALLLSPDPTQPFKNSRYKQKQIFDLGDGASLFVLDWVNEGRRARGERWDCVECRLGCEVWRVSQPAPANGIARADNKAGPQRKLLLRDNVLLTADPSNPSALTRKMDNLGIFGTLILHGPIFSNLSSFFMEEFHLLPRIGGRDWGDNDEKSDPILDRPDKRSDGIDPFGTVPDKHDEAVVSEERRRRAWRRQRWKAEKDDGVLWSAAQVRGCVVVKFGAREVEGGRRWLGDMLGEEGTVRREFGEGGMMSMR